MPQLVNSAREGLRGDGAVSLLRAMTPRFTRRFVLGGLAGGMAGGLAPAALAKAPLSSIRPKPRTAAGPVPGGEIVAAAGLGGRTSFAIADAGTGEILEVMAPESRLSPASVTKAATAFYALDRLGPDYRFVTELVATGPVVKGRLQGDLVLRGGGDPTLDTDAMADLSAALREAGVNDIAGKLRIDASCLPSLPWIDPDQPDHVGYNPAIAGLNLNFNRVHFEWTRKSSDYEITMQARALRFRPAVRIARMAIEDRTGPVYTYEDTGTFDSWTVARRALGAEGARWLPVRRPADYAAEVFLSLARSHGLALKRGADASAEVTGTVLARHESAPLRGMLEGMLRYSTNLTAEAVGLKATLEQGEEPGSLIRSAREMNRWFNGELGARSTGFVDHSGLGYGSQVSAPDMVRILLAARRERALKPILREMKTDAPDARVFAKTGTLNFVSTLAGYIELGDRRLAFAIFSADRERRDAIRVEDRERPPGARGWARRARAMQSALIESWSARHTV